MAAGKQFKQTKIGSSILRISIVATLAVASPITIANTSGWDKIVGITSTVDKAGKDIISSMGVAINGGTSADENALSESAKKEAEACAAGAEGSQGEAIQNAVGIHTTIASVGPDVEKFFNQNHDCFAKLNKLYDLSFSIPSLSSILNKAQEAVIDYATQKACTAVKEATTEIVAPLNAAIDKVNNQYGKYLDLNGMANGAVSGGLSKLDPSLGSTYSNSAPAASYTIQPFSTEQTTFNNSSAGGGGNSSGSTEGGYTYNNQLGQLNELNKLLQNEQIKLPGAQQTLATAQNRLNNCQSRDVGNCSGYAQQVQQAQAAVAQIQNNIKNYQNQVAILSGNPVTSGAMKIETTPPVAANGQAQAQAQAAPASSGGKDSGGFSGWLKNAVTR